MSPQPTPPHDEQMRAALDTAGEMLARITPADTPREIVLESNSAFPAADLPDVVGVIMRLIRYADALERYQRLFGGTLTSTRRGCDKTRIAYTEHILIGEVHGVPYLATAYSDFEPVEALPQRAPGASGGTAAGAAALRTGAEAARS